MSLSAGLPGFKSTDGGLKFSGFQGPVLAGKIADGVGASLPAAGGVMCVQSTASITNQVVTTSATTVNSRASFIYIPVTTGTLQGAGAPAYVGVGAALVFNNATRRLEVWSSDAAEWLTMSSSGTFSSS
jgi:hypothetical protein